MTTKMSPIERLKAAFGTRDAKEFDAAAAELETNDSGLPQIHIHTGTKDAAPQPLELRMEKMEKTMDALAKHLLKTKDESEEEDDKDKKKTEDGEDEDEDKEKDKTEDGLLEEEEEDQDGKTMDAAAEYASLVSGAEIIAPGYTLPKMTKDAESSPKKTRDALCACKRRALDAALKTEDGKKAVTKFLRGKTVDKLSAEAVDAVFVGAVEVMRAGNNTKTKVKDATPTVDAFSKNGINTINKAFWAKK